MKALLKSVFSKLNGPIDAMLSFLVVPGARLLLIYRTVGSGRLPRTTMRLKKIGLFPIRDHYTEPLFNDRQLSNSLASDRKLPGLDLNVSGQLQFLKDLKYSDELIAERLDQQGADVDSFCIENSSFASGDAEFLYQFLRHVKPKSVVEIGSGNSTKIARMALNRNRTETGSRCRHLCIEPYEQPWLERLDGVSVIRKRVEELDFDWANELGPGDLLFVDSSHVIRPQGDVVKEYLEIFPSLKPGVFVHIHDIFTPKDYLKSWVVDEVRLWNEQYLLEALLTNSNRYEVVAALNFLKHSQYASLKEVCPYITPQREPGSFYLRVKG